MICRYCGLRIVKRLIGWSHLRPPVYWHRAKP